MITVVEQTKLKARNGQLEEALKERDRWLERLAQEHAKKECELTQESLVRDHFAGNVGNRAS